MNHYSAFEISDMGKIVIPTTICQAFKIIDEMLQAGDKARILRMTWKDAPLATRLE